MKTYRIDDPSCEGCDRDNDDLRNCICYKADAHRHRIKNVIFFALVIAGMALLVIFTGCRTPEPLHFTDAEMESMCTNAVRTNASGTIYFKL